MCIKVGDVIPVNYTVIQEFGNAAHMALTGGVNGHAFLFPDKAIQHCDQEKGCFYYESRALLFVYGIKIPLEPGYEQHGKQRIFKPEDRMFSICVSLLPQKPEEKKNGIHSVKLISMTI